MVRYRWMVFDADGTLFDYDSAEVAALASTFRQYGVVFDAEVHRVFTAINGRLWTDLENGGVTSARLRVQRFEELAATLGLELSATDFSADYLAHLGAQCGLIDGAEELVARLSRDCTLVLATNGIADVQRSRIAASSLRDAFAAVVISDEVGAAKPAAGFFRELFARIGDPDPAEVLMVGDGLGSDIKGGADFGIDTCWYNPTGQVNETPVEPTYEVSELRQVWDIARGPR